MEAIIRGTTPTITFTFNDVPTSSIAVAYFIVKQRGNIVIEKTMNAISDITENSISWTFTQSESLALKMGYEAKIYCDWKLQNGTRGRSKEGVYFVEEAGKPEVI